MISGPSSLPPGIGSPGGGGEPNLDSLNQALSASNSNSSASALSGLTSGLGGGAKLGSSSSAGASGPAGNLGASAQNQQPREVSTIKEELIKRPLSDISAEIKETFSLNRILGINPQVDTPETQAKKRQTLATFNSLTQQEQQVAQKRIQAEMERKQRQAEEDAYREQQKQAASQTIQLPASPQKGPAGPAGSSKKAKATNQLKQDRTTMGKIQGAN